MPWVTIRNQRLFFSQHEKRDSPAISVLLIHGAGGTHLDWPRELLRLEHINVYAIDLPGHGRSDPPGCKSIDEYADFVASFIATLGCDRIVLIGHSMGGGIAQSIGQRAISQVAGLVLIATGARLRVTPAILDNVLSDIDGVIDVITEYAWSDSASDDLKQMGRSRLNACDPDVLHGDYTACNEFDLLSSLDQIRVPTLVISGTEDRLTPMKYGAFLADAIPDAGLKPVDGAGHMVMLEKPEAVAQSVLSFLRELPSD
jgi:pimeloyl-ACP methyl ester carboxylesterase